MTINDIIDKISLDTIKNFLFKKKSILISLFMVWVILFGLYYFYAERKYTSTMEIIPSESNQSPSSLLGSFGVNLPIGNSVDYNSAILYPDIVKSNRLITKIIYSNIIFEDQKVKVKDIFTEKYFSKSKKKGLLEDDIDLLLIDFFKNEIINVSRNRMTDITTVDITTFDSSLSQILGLEVFNIFNTMQLEKRNENLDSHMNYTLARIDEVSKNLEKLQTRKIDFLKSNNSALSPQLSYELERIVTEIDIEKSVFFSLRDKYEIFEIEKNNLSNLASFIDHPIKSIKHSHPSFRLNFVISLLALFIIYSTLFIREITYSSYRKI